jgi:hypothetical protein
VSVIHWKSPVDRPRNHRATEYYFEGSYLGKGDEGISKALEQLAMKKPSAVAFVGGRYERKESYSFREVPYAFGWAGKINETLRTNQIREVTISPYLF